MPAACEAARKARALVLSQGHSGHVLFKRPAIALRPNATLLPVEAAKSLISFQRACVRQNVVFGGQGAPGTSYTTRSPWDPPTRKTAGESDFARNTRLGSVRDMFITLQPRHAGHSSASRCQSRLKDT